MGERPLAARPRQPIATIESVLALQREVDNIR